MTDKDVLPLPKKQPRFYNALPVAYKTWLEFYDSIPEEYREESHYRCVIRVSPEQYRQLYQEEPEPFLMHQAEYEISREWLLARVAEQLLPARLTKQNVSALESALHRVSKYDPSDIFTEAIELLTPIWAVAKNR